MNSFVQDMAAFRLIFRTMRTHSKKFASGLGGVTIEEIVRESDQDQEMIMRMMHRLVANGMVVSAVRDELMPHGHNTYSPECGKRLFYLTTKPKQKEKPNA